MLILVGNIDEDKMKNQITENYKEFFFRGDFWKVIFGFFVNERRIQYLRVEFLGCSQYFYSRYIFLKMLILTPKPQQNPALNSIQQMLENGKTAKGKEGKKEKAYIYNN